MQVVFHKHVWLFTKYMPILHWWTGASYVSPYVMTVTWWTTSGIIIHHWSIAYELFTYCSSLIYFSVATVTTTTKTPKHLLFRCYCYNYYKKPKPFIFSVATITITIIPLLLLNTLLQILSYPGVVELTTQLLILKNILWLPFCRINKFGLYFTHESCCDPLHLWVIKTNFWHRCRGS